VTDTKELNSKLKKALEKTDSQYPNRGNQTIESEQKITLG